MVEAIKLIIISANKEIAPFRKILVLYSANPVPMAKREPIKGEISIAPIIIAVEFTFNPILAIKIAQVKIIKLSIFKVPSSLILVRNCGLK